jgi:hypothetical protein
MSTIYLFRRKTAAAWTSANPILLPGELGLETDTTKFKFGNGTTAWNSLAYAGASVGTVPWGAISGTLSAQADLVAALAAKQATLVAGTNIKTINGSTILGSGDLIISGGGGGISDGDKGDITVSGSGTVWTIDNDAVTNAKLANVATATLKGRTTAGTGDPEDLTGTQATALLDAFTSVAKGLVPASGGGTTNFLRADGTFAAPGGGGSPGGSTTQLQFNNAGAFGGASSALIEGSELRLPSIATPTAPAAGGVKFFGAGAAEGARPAFLSERGGLQVLQSDIGRGAIAMAQPVGNNTTVSAFGCVITVQGTTTTKNTTDTNCYTRVRAVEYLQTTPAVNNVAGGRLGNAQWTVGGGVAGRGGFRFYHVFGPSIGVTSLHKAFCGMFDNTGAANDADPSTNINIIGFGYDGADANVQLMHNDGSGVCTKIDLGASFPKPSADRTNVYDCEMYSPPGTTQSVGYRITNRATGAVASGTVTTNLPTTSTFLATHMWAAITASAVIGVLNGGMYVETLGIA